ncbi:UNVERIFIED_CONTAM: Adenylyltransferase and sulfurtransferase MOCS3 [Sesamum angustifolium]|uniref:Adenylyltransferase and sulfurtransferase MOCS3 n=1 Tax=Sesamum angustifolium TaxID=2727405 RepID=A0AAW2IW57_9LAMI
MDSNGVAETPADIRREIASLEKAKAEIDDRITALRVRLSSYGSVNGNEVANSSAPRPRPEETLVNGQLSPDMIYRYSRHLLLPSVGVEAQANLLKCSVLVIGAGGLGSPALLYLAACGIGRVGIVDHDVVELNNLHRQIIHTEAYIGRSKVESAAAACRAINSTVQIVEHREAFRTSNALEIVRKYDIVVDATDNVPSRYMISDCCVVLGKPLISGAALGLEGQLTVYNYKGVPGVIGCLQALEAIKVAGAVGEPLSGRMLLFDALSARIRVVKIRGRSPQCEACGENSKFTEEQFCNFNYETFTQSPLSTSPLKLHLLPSEARITSKEYNERIVKALAREEGHKNNNNSQSASLYVICRRGNDSQRAVQYLHKMGFASAKDIIGGLESWAHDVDPSFPTY